MSRAACDFFRFVRRGGVRVVRAARRGAVDRPNELAVTLLDLSTFAIGDGSLEAPGQGLDRRAVPQVLEPLAGGAPDALLLLPDVRHSVEMPATAGAGMVANPPRSPQAARSGGRHSSSPL